MEEHPARARPGPEQTALCFAVCGLWPGPGGALPTLSLPSRRAARQGWYEPYVQCETSGRDPRDFADYLAKMGRDGEWGDHVTLQARTAQRGAREERARPQPSSRRERPPEARLRR